MKFALEVRQGRESAGEFAESLSAQIQLLGGSVITDDKTPPDIVVGVGGDGTMLGAVRRSLIWDVPVIGFNLGTLGFLAEAEPPDLEPTVRRLIAG
ncbi:MAG: NAD(+)/NADH kinase, partial [Acidimicrobiia bacterium]